MASIKQPNMLSEALRCDGLEVALPPCTEANSRVT